MAKYIQKIMKKEKKRVKMPKKIKKSVRKYGKNKRKETEMCFSNQITLSYIITGARKIISLFNAYMPRINVINC